MSYLAGVVLDGTSGDSVNCLAAELIEHLDLSTSNADIREFMQNKAKDKDCPLGQLATLSDNDCIPILSTCVLRVLKSIKSDDEADFVAEVNLLRSIGNFLSMTDCTRRPKLLTQMLAVSPPYLVVDCFYAFSMAFFDEQEVLLEHFTSHLSKRSALALIKEAKRQAVKVRGQTLCTNRRRWLSSVEHDLYKGKIYSAVGRL